MYTRHMHHAQMCSILWRVLIIAVHNHAGRTQLEIHSGQVTQPAQTVCGCYQVFRQDSQVTLVVPSFKTTPSTPGYNVSALLLLMNRVFFIFFFFFLTNLLYNLKQPLHKFWLKSWHDCKECSSNGVFIKLMSDHYVGGISATHISV